MNPRNRKLKASTPPRVYLDRAAQIVDRAAQIAALLDAAGELDAESRPDRQHIGRRTILTALAFAGLRIGELCSLRWGDVDLAAGRLRVAKAKTDAGIRYVALLAALREELAVRKAGIGRAVVSDYVFGTSNGNAHSKDERARARVAAGHRASEPTPRRARRGAPTGSLTLHGLRHTFASILVALGEDRGHVMDQVGHTDPAFTLRVYRHAMRREDGDKERLRALVEGELQAPAGTSHDFERQDASASELLDASEAADMQEEREARPAGFEPATSRSGGGRSIH